MVTKLGAPSQEPRIHSGPAVEVRALGHRFGELEALAGLDLSVPAGEVLGIVGPSGCGKSTLLELVAGLQEPDEGVVTVLGATAPRLATVRPEQTRGARGRGLR